MDQSQFQSLIDEAFAALHDGDSVRALGIGDQLAAEAPESPVAHAIRAQALVGAADAEEFLKEALRAVELAPHDGHAHRLLALAAWRNGRLGQAQESFRRALGLTGRAPAVLSEYAWFMASERGPKLAQEAAQAAVDADERSSTAWAALGLAQYRLHRFAEAEASLRRALQLNPNDIYAVSAMVGLLQDQRKDDKAEALVSMLKGQAGTEEVVESVQQQARERRIAGMLVQRKVDLDTAVGEPRRYRWIWLLGATAFVTLMLCLVDRRWLYAAPAIALVLLVLLRRWLD
jgi:Tfp pilus assembly protein PilF